MPVHLARFERLLARAGKPERTEDFFGDLLGNLSRHADTIAPAAARGKRCIRAQQKAPSPSADGEGARGDEPYFWTMLIVHAEQSPITCASPIFEPSTCRPPACPRRWKTISAMFATPVAPSGWPFESSPPLAFTTAVVFRLVALVLERCDVFLVLGQDLIPHPRCAARHVRGSLAVATKARFS